MNRVKVSKDRKDVMEPPGTDKIATTDFARNRSAGSAAISQHRSQAMLERKRQVSQSTAGSNRSFVSPVPTSIRKSETIMKSLKSISSSDNHRHSLRREGRSRSAPNNRLPNGGPPRRSTTFEQPPLKERTKGSRSDEVVSGSFASVKALGSEVQDLLLLMVECDQSPLRRTRSYSTHTQRDDSGSRKVAEEREFPKSAPMRRDSQSRKRDFDSLEWSQQRRLLRRELRRLTLWILQFPENRLPENNGDYVVFCDALISIGQSLRHLLDQNLQSQRMMERLRIFERIAKSQEKAISVASDIDWRPLDDIQSGINKLFEPESRRRKSVAVDDMPKTPEAPLTSAQIDRLEWSEMGPPRKAMKVHFPDRLESSNNAMVKSATNGSQAADGDITPKPILKSADVPRTPIPVSSSENISKLPEGSFVLRIADRSDAFKSAQPEDPAQSSSLASSTASRPTIRRLATGDMPANIRELITSFEGLSLNLKFPVSNITTRLLEVGKPTNIPSTESQNTSSMKSLVLLDKVLGLLESLSLWRIYTSTDQDDHTRNTLARSAVSVIYLSLLESIVSFASEASVAIQQHLKCHEDDSSTLHNVQIFYDYVHRFSLVLQSIKGVSERFQTHLARVVSDLNGLMHSPEHDVAKEQVMDVANSDEKGEGDDNLKSVPETTQRSEEAMMPRHCSYEPLALACYIVAPEACVKTEQRLEEFAAKSLVSIQVKDLFSAEKVPSEWQAD